MTTKRVKEHFWCDTVAGYIIVYMFSISFSLTFRLNFYVLSSIEITLCRCPQMLSATGAPNENIVQNHLNIAWLNVF